MVDVTSVNSNTQGLEPNEYRQTFFELIFGKNVGYLNIITIRDGNHSQKFFRYPENLNLALEHIAQYTAGQNVYFCPQLLGKERRKKDDVVFAVCSTADLDDCPPEKLLVEPSVVIESSPGRYQGIWIYEESVEPFDAEDVNKRIAYAHEKDGADIGCHDLAHIFRVPLTYNYKYESPNIEPPLVKVITANRNRYRLSDFECYPAVTQGQYTEVPMPELNGGRTAEQILNSHRYSLHPLVWDLFYQEPNTYDDWSKRLWSLETFCIESGVSINDVFVIANEAKCNKYERDGRDISLLWKEICKAWAYVDARNAPVIPTGDLENPLLNDKQRELVESQPSFVERYIEWAKTLGDAAGQYHQAGAFITLSSLLAGTVRLPTSFGVIIPNLWFMILADTTLTRKTTAMDIAMDLIMEVDSDCVLATDGSIEGLLTSLSTRPGRPSIFLRDEFSGLLEAISKKEYYAGMGEALTKLYDGKYQKRVLRREVVEVRDPIVVLFAGGIRKRIYQLLTFDNVTSGFLPRFCFITAESDISKLRPLGPPTEATTGKRDAMLAELIELHGHYTVAGQSQSPAQVLFKPKYWSAELDEEVWTQFARYETAMLNAGLGSENPDVFTPSFDRLAKSGLKAAVLIAATRQRPEEGKPVKVEMIDLLRAFYYVDIWKQYTVEVLRNIGKTIQEQMFDAVLTTIRRKPGISRAELMQYHRMTAQQAEMTFITLTQRGVINVEKAGRTLNLFPVV